MVLGSVNVFAAGGAVSIGDSSGETLFTGSASSHCLLLSSNGVVSAWGSNTYGQCGTEPCEELTEINYIDFEDKIVKVAAGNDFSIALDENNVAWGWGNNISFQLGISRPTGPGTPTQFSVPQKIADNIVDIAAGEDFSILLSENGDVLFSGMRNPNTLKGVEFPKIDTKNPKIKFITANYNNAIAVDENNFVFYWRSDRRTPEVIEFNGVDEVQSVAVGKEHLIIRCLNGENIEFYGYGDNSKSQLGVLDVSSADEPVLVLSIPYEENLKISEFAGDYYTVVDVWDNLSANDLMSEYRWGTICYVYGDIVMIDQITINEPEENSVEYQTIALGSERNIAFDFVNNKVILSGKNTALHSIPLIEADEETDVMYEYQYQDLAYHTYKVNFVKLNEEKFPNDNKIIDESTGDYSDKYLYWEFVNEHEFRVKIKNFINGLGNSSYNPAISSIALSKEATGENRLIGAYGPSVWNFDCGNEAFRTDKSEVLHGGEDGTELIVSAYTLNMRDEKPLNIPQNVSVFYENPGEITENTKLGLYLYGLPEGTTGTITDIAENTFKITLAGNSTADMDYDSDIKLCYVRTDGNDESGSVVGDYDLNAVSVYAGKRELAGFIIKAVENTPEILTVSGTVKKGSESGAVINASVSGGTFAEDLSADAWRVTGLDNVTVSKVNRLDDNSAELTLSGSSADKYTDAEMHIVCDASQYSDSRVYDEDTGRYLDSELVSDNFIIVSGQPRSTGRGLGSSTVIAKPSSSIPSGEVVKGTAIELSSAVNAKIYYTTDGTEPTAQSTLYQSPIEISDDITIKFIAVSDTRKSAVQTVTYTVKKADVKLKENSDKIRYLECESGYFRPDEPITRYEVLSALNNLFDVENLEISSNFTDMDDKYSNIVDLFVGAGIIDGYPDNTFRGEEGITRAEFVKILSIMLKTKESEETIMSDISGHWCEKYINGFEKLGLVNGYPDGSFKPNSIITKAEAVTVLNKVSGVSSENNDSITFKDVSEKHWAYRDICRAVQNK